jgi:hypothetical protein
MYKIVGDHFGVDPFTKMKIPDSSYTKLTQQYSKKNVYAITINT